MQLPNLSHVTEIFEDKTFSPLSTLYVLLEADDGNVSILHRGQRFLVTFCNYDVSNTTSV
jgi:hypothetical protein